MRSDLRKYALLSYNRVKPNPCAVGLSQLCHCDVKVVPLRWKSCDIVMAQNGEEDPSRTIYNNIEVSLEEAFDAITTM